MDWFVGGKVTLSEKNREFVSNPNPPSENPFAQFPRQAGDTTKPKPEGLFHGPADRRVAAQHVLTRAEMHKWFPTGTSIH